jgi:hypothetical protein
MPTSTATTVRELIALLQDSDPDLPVSINGMTVRVTETSEFNNFEDDPPIVFLDATEAEVPSLTLVD